MSIALSSSTRNASTLSILNEVGSRLVAENEIAKIIQAVTDGGRTISQAAYGAFFHNSLHGDSRLCYPCILSGLPPETAAKAPQLRDAPLFARVLTGRHLLRLPDLGVHSEFAGSLPQAGDGSGLPPIRSFMGVPVLSRNGEVLGGLFYGHPDPGIFTEDAELAISGLASQAALAIDNSNLKAALQRELGQRRLSEAAAQRFTAIVRSSNDAIISKDLNSIVTSWNEGAQRIFGYTAEEMIGKSITLLIPQNHIDEEPEILHRIKRGETLNHYETVRRRKDGTLINISLTVSPIKDEKGVIIGASKIARDITELKSTEEQLRQAQKMEAVGRLAGGIAHDFNNLLTSIIGFVDLALDEAPAGSEIAEYLEEVRKSGHRAATLTQQLLAYSRKQMLAPRVIDLNEGVAEIDRMLRRLIGEDILFHSNLDPNLGKVKADPSQIQQIIVNLVLNARDAMPQGGTLSLRTANVILDSDHVAAHPEATVGPHVMLSVCDTGYGMTPEILARIFEPFFTTKDVGKGTGLGLSSVYGIVKQSGASIAVTSRPGKGSEFRIYFPLVKTDPEEASKATGHGKGRTAARGETILLAEDEGTVRRFLVTILKQQGYTVLDAKDGAEALEMAKNHSRIDLLVTDMIMPNMNGGELARRARVIHAGLPILYISGYTRDIPAFDGTDGPHTRYLQKPFTQSDLLGRIRETIAAGKAAAGRF